MVEPFRLVEENMGNTRHPQTMKKLHSSGLNGLKITSLFWSLTL